MNENKEDILPWGASIKKKGSKIEKKETLAEA